MSPSWSATTTWISSPTPPFPSTYAEVPGAALTRSKYFQFLVNVVFAEPVRSVAPVYLSLNVNVELFAAVTSKLCVPTLELPKVIISPTCTISSPELPDATVKSVDVFAMLLPDPIWSVPDPDDTE